MREHRARGRVAAYLFLLGWTLACGDSEESPPSAPDAGEPDAHVEPDAAPPMDARVPEEHDAAVRDAEPEPKPDAMTEPMPRDDAGTRTAAWTVLVYMAADNNLEKAGIDDLIEMLGVKASQDVNVIVQIDRTVGFYDLGVAGLANWESMKRFRVSDGRLEELADLGELDTGVPKTLSDFLSWGLRTYPAERRAIVLWDHGNAWRGYGGDDTSDKDQLDEIEIAQGMADGIHGAGLQTVDMIGFDACLMSSTSTAELVQGFTRYLVASEELVPGNGWDYQASLQYLVDHPDADAPSFAATIISAFYAQSRANREHRDVTCNLLDLSKFPAVEAAMSSLLDVAETHLADTARDIADAQLHALEYGHHADPTMAHHMRDLGDFARRLADGDSVYASGAASLKQALQSLVVTSAYGSNKKDSTGLSVYFPPRSAFYDARFDDVPQQDRWRKFLKAFYAHADASQVEAPAFEDAHESHPVGAGSVELPAQAMAGCDPSEGPSVTAPLSPGDAEQIAQALLVAGFVETATGKVHVFSREQAQIDLQAQRVVGTWDRHVLVAQQGSRTQPLFAEIALDEQRRYASAEVPFVYSEPVACACAQVGAPGYSDMDADGMPDCADGDVDADGVPDKTTHGEKLDNCPWLANPQQEDTDQDGTGDACEGGSGAPSLGCVPAPSGDFGALLPAVWRVVVDRHDRNVESDTLYVMDIGGTAELTPEVGGVLWPRRLIVKPDGTSEFHTDPPLPFNLHEKVDFDYADSALLYAQNSAGHPLLDANLMPVPLLASMGLGDAYLHLELVDFSGRGDVAVSISDVSNCDPPVLDVCPGAEEPDCEGRCIEAQRVRPNGVCDDGTNGSADLYCELYDFDDGECTRPSCAGGFVRDCNGQCTLPDGILGDGKCDALAACRALGWDEGDCVCGPDCSGHGTCGAGGCMCDSGWAGAYCDQPPSCGDGTCSAAALETCVTCVADCGACPVACGDGACKRGNGESCVNCPADCGSCRCGDGVCTHGSEDCTSCVADCGACPSCGDFVCARWSANANFPAAMQEHCGNCAVDCGTCQGDCCAAAGELGDATTRVGCGEPAIARCVCALDASCCNTSWSSECASRAISECSLVCENCTDAEGGDVDGDGACGGIDNCPSIANPTQADVDLDDIGDLCDLCYGDDRRDADRDRIPDTCDLCPHHADNPENDADGDGVGDACDPCRTLPNADRDPRACSDGDQDGVPDVIDNCPSNKNATQLDGDGDGRGDACDNCIAVANYNQDPAACACPGTAEVCDNYIDDNCNGQVDEGCTCEGVLEVCDGADNDCDDAMDEGCPPCKPTVEICGDMIDQDCDNNPDDGCLCSPLLERCANAVDDDCDRIIDEAACDEPQ